MRKLFPLGRILITPGAVELLNRVEDDHHLRLAAKLIDRHQRGDWGLVGEDDAAANAYALQHGLRLFSAYDLPGGLGRVWVITESDRSATTVLLPSEY